LARLAVTAGAIERVVGALTGASRVALLAWALSARDYGLYVAALGVVATAGLVDFGIQFGLVNAVSDARGRDDDGAFRGMLATAFLVYAAIAAVALCVFIPFALFAPMQSLFHLAPDRVGLARAIIVIGFGGALLTMPLQVYPAAFVGMQQQHVSSIFRTVAGIAQLAGMAASLLIWKGGLLAVVAVSVVTDVVFDILFAAWAARHRVLIHLRSAERRYARRLVGSGITFFVSNMANLLKRSSAALVIVNALGPEVVPSFSVPFALFTLGLSVSEMLGGSLWPAYGEAAARGDWAWISRAFAIGSDIALHAAAIIAALGVVGGSDAMALWAPKIALPPPTVFALLAIWMLTQASAHISCSLLGGLNRNLVSMWVNVAEGVATFGGGLWAVRHWGVEGVIGAMIVAGAASAIYLAAFTVPRETQRQVTVALATYARVAVCGVAAAVVGFGVDRVASTWPVILRMLATAVAITVTYGGGAWTVGLSADARERILRRMHRGAPT
jgi:O-antigen/teichoic acid export membrane protein